MNKNELMKYAELGLEAEIQKREKQIRNGERLIRPYLQGRAVRDERVVCVEKRINEIRSEIEMLDNKLFDLRWEITNGPVNV